MKKLKLVYFLFVLIWIFVACQETPKEIIVDNFGITNQVILDNIENGIHTPTGLKAGAGIESVLRHCVSCHSSKLISQNRADIEGWESMIKWMYETQNLPNLGDQEGIIVKYLAEHYGPTESGRRKELVVENWYNLD